MKKIRTKKEISQSILKGLEEALEIAKGKKAAKRNRNIVISELPLYKGNDVKKIRRKIDVTQKIFAEVLGVSVKTVEAWEGNRNIPDGPAQRLIYAIDNNPQFLETIGIKV
ncbi:MAG: transcriptional regulator [Ignavibacteria bacterium]|nr:transcriptional regulator [Ignavibacteria bacterium]